MNAEGLKTWSLTNLRVAYNAIFANFCDKELQNRLENREDFVSKIENDPIELLSAIKDMMHTMLHEKLIFRTNFRTSFAKSLLIFNFRLFPGF